MISITTTIIITTIIITSIIRAQGGDAPTLPPEPRGSRPVT